MTRGTTTPDCSRRHTEKQDVVACTERISRGRAVPGRPGVGVYFKTSV